MGIDPDKYIVFNRRDWEHPLPADEIPDAVVIRLQDVFAPAVLSNYAHQIDLVLKLSPDMPKEQRRNLTDLSLYFQYLSLRAEEQQSTKLPTL